MDLVDDQIQEKNLSELAKRIREARKAAHLSQHDLGASVGVSDKSISAYEQGRSVPPLKKLKEIANATDHPLTYFTQENVDDAKIAALLTSIEREFGEVRRLLKERKIGNTS